jgi:chromate transporter
MEIPPASPSPQPEAVPAPPFKEALRYWHRLGWISFGGPIAQIAMMHEDLVQKRRWVDESRFRSALAFCSLLPGPEAQQLATCLGWFLHGVRGGLAAGLLFLLPSILILLGAASIYAHWGSLRGVAGFYAGLKPAVVAIIAMAVLRLARNNLKHDVHVWVLCAAVALSVIHVPILLILLAAALAGWWWSDLFLPGTAPPQRASWVLPKLKFELPREVLWPLVVGGVLWLMPLILGWLLGALPWFWGQARFYTGTALFSFGGAYTVLPYVWQGAVNDHGWITTSQMMDALALGETTPGPLIMVVSFVGHLSSWNHFHWLEAGSRDLLALLGGLLAVWYTFLPGTLAALVGAAYLHRLHQWPRAAAVLSAIAAAVVGMISLLGLKSLGHLVSGGKLWLDAAQVMMAIVATLLLWKRPQLALWKVVLGCGGVGVILSLF